MKLRIDGGFEYVKKETGEVKYCYHCSTEAVASGRAFGRSHVDVWCDSKQAVLLDHTYEAVLDQRITSRGISMVPVGFDPDSDTAL